MAANGPGHAAGAVRRSARRTAGDLLYGRRRIGRRGRRAGRFHGAPHDAPTFRGSRQFKARCSATDSSRKPATELSTKKTNKPGEQKHEDQPRTDTAATRSPVASSMRMLHPPRPATAGSPARPEIDRRRRSSPSTRRARNRGPARPPGSGRTRSAPSTRRGRVRLGSPVSRQLRPGRQVLRERRRDISDGPITVPPTAAGHGPAPIRRAPVAGRPASGSARRRAD